MSSSPDKNSHRGVTVTVMARLWRENIRPYRGWIVLALLAMAAMAAATGLSAWLMKPVVNSIFIDRRADLMVPVAAAIFVTFLVKGAANYAQSAIMSRIGFRVIADNQDRLYAHLLRMDLQFFHENPTGRLISRFTTDIGSMRAAVSNALVGLGKDLLTLLALVGVMFVQNWELALVSFFVFPAAVYPISRLGRRMRKVTARTQDETGLLMTLLEETIQGVRVVKAYGMQAYERARVAELTDRIYRLSFKAARTRAASSPIMETLGGVAVVVVILYGGHQVIGGHTTAGEFFSFITALLMAYEPMKRLANLNSSLQEGVAGAQRLFALLDHPEDILEKPEAAKLEVHQGRVHLEDVHFSYESGKPVLTGIDIEVPAGRTVALVGPSGAGKSTVLNLIPRFYDVTGGRVTVDGMDIREATLASLRSAMALVSQEITLFDDTIRANIAYGRLGATEDEIVEAARHAAAHDFIMELPQGYDTFVGERGVKLSGGQRQRLAIARAMLKNAPILLLDEATSALDTESERKVQAALKELMKGRTTLVIAHRLSTIADADTICVLAEGRVAEQGSHAELLAKGGLYATLYAMQFAEQPSGEQRP